MFFIINFRFHKPRRKRIDMSLKLFLLNALGGIKATSKIESEKEILWKDYQAFTAVESSDELKEFLKLEEQVQADSFQKQKKELKGLTFKGSPEERQLKQYNRLKRKKTLRNYYQTLTSSDLKRYEELKSSNKLDRYFELKESMSHKPDKNDEKAMEEWREFQSLKKSDDVNFFHKYPRSKAYRNYLHVKDSEDLREFESLQKHVEADEFKQRKAYLDDPRKWEKTEQYKAEQQYESLKNKQTIQLYLKYKDSNLFDFFKSWDLVFEDRFDQGTLDESKWKPVLYWAAETVGHNFSQEGDLQAYNDGKNVHLKDARLKIQVKKDKVNSFLWNPTLGFVEKEFDYSSDTLTTGGLFEADHGILEAKIKYNPNKGLQDVFFLSDSENKQRINLLEAGVINRVGLLRMNNGTAQHETFSLAGLGTGKFYIFRLEWEKGKLSWKINDRELFTVNSQVPDSPMFINLASLVVHNTQTLPHNFEIDWIRFYQPKN